MTTLAPSQRTRRRSDPTSLLHPLVIELLNHIGTEAATYLYILRLGVVGVYRKTIVGQRKPTVGSVLIVVLGGHMVAFCGRFLLFVPPFRLQGWETSLAR